MLAQMCAECQRFGGTNDLQNLHAKFKGSGLAACYNGKCSSFVFLLIVVEYYLFLCALLFRADQRLFTRVNQRHILRWSGNSGRKLLAICGRHRLLQCVARLKHFGDRLREPKTYTNHHNTRNIFCASQLLLFTCDICDTSSSSRSKLDTLRLISEPVSLVREPNRIEPVPVPVLLPVTL